MEDLQDFLKGKKYKSFGLLEKESTKIDQIGLVHLDQEVLYNINYNLNQFKRLITDAYNK